MRASEFMVEDEESLSTFNLLTTLEDLRSSRDQIRVDALVKMVSKQRGSEMFNVDLLKSAWDSGKLENIVDNITKDDSGVTYLYFKPLSSDDFGGAEKVDRLGGGRPSPNPEQTVSAMAKRASSIG